MAQAWIVISADKCAIAAFWSGIPCTNADKHSDAGDRSPHCGPAARFVLAAARVADFRSERPAALLRLRAWRAPSGLWGICGARTGEGAVGRKLEPLAAACAAFGVGGGWATAVRAHSADVDVQSVGRGVSEVSVCRRAGNLRGRRSCTGLAPPDARYLGQGRSRQERTPATDRSHEQETQSHDDRQVCVRIQ